MSSRDIPDYMLSPVISLAGKHAVPVDHRDKMALLQGGTLLVAQSYRNEMHVLAYMQLLKRAGIEFAIKFVEVADIQRVYQAAAATGGKVNDNSVRQRQVVDLMKEAVEAGASDVHFRNGEKTTEVLFRVDGFLGKVHEYKAEDGRAICGTIYQSMCDVASTSYEQMKSQDGRIKREYLNQLGLYGARVATRPLQYGNLMVLRLLKQRAGQTLESLGYFKPQIALIEQMTKRTHGINIFSGATGSGKSTSLQVLLNNWMQGESGRHLLTIEDPPEAPIVGAVQTQLVCDHNDPVAIATEWVRSISNAMRLDPDSIMIGEMRDKDSATTAIRAAMTGHSVWTTVHANNAFQIMDRLIDIGVSPGFVTDASLMTGFINQSLVARTCKYCAKPYKSASAGVSSDLHERIAKFCRGGAVKLRGTDRNCTHCGGRGISGRIVVAEAVIPTQKLMLEYRSNGSSAARSMWVKAGGITKCAALIELVRQGLVDPVIAEKKVCMLNEDELTLA